MRSAETSGHQEGRETGREARVESFMRAMEIAAERQKKASQEADDAQREYMEEHTDEELGIGPDSSVLDEISDAYAYRSTEEIRNGIFPFAEDLWRLQTVGGPLEGLEGPDAELLRKTRWLALGLTGGMSLSHERQKTESWVRELLDLLEKTNEMLERRGLPKVEMAINA